LLAYLRADFGRGVDSQVLVDPIACAFALVDAPASLAPWRSVIGAALVAMLIAAILVVRRRSKAHLRARDNSAPTYPQPGQRLSH
jgi:hypothetical protein